ncbi:MAG: class I SAM-dependent methyltransferase [Eubacteriales bacterium]|nr:class I SAM-dependent methyltransferase [Eubacteriales bacterium]
MKYHIEKNTVQETLIIPLYARKKCTEKFPDLFQDEFALHFMDEIDYDFSELEKKSGSSMQEFGFLEVAMRQNDLTFEIKDYLKSHPRAAVVNMGCGLDNTGRNCDNGSCRIYNIDFPDVIEIRNQLLPAGEREKNIASDLRDPAWFQEIDSSQGVVFFAAGVFYYFLTEDVKTLFLALEKRFPGGRLVFDSCGKAGAKMMRKTWLKQAGIQDVDAYFSVGDTQKDLAVWSETFRVSCRGYMLGYQSLDLPSVKKMHRILSRVGDNLMKMKIVRIDFTGT